MKSIKTTGIEFNTFLHSDWSLLGKKYADAYMDDEEMYCNGEQLEHYDGSDFHPDDKIEIKGGVISFNNDPNTNLDLMNFFSRWRKIQTKRCVIVEYNIKDFTLESLKEAVEKLGLKIIA
jgi:hypothetical protein